MLKKEHFLKLKSMAHVYKLTGLEFEYFCKFLLEHIGYESALVTTKHGKRKGDGGVDITCTQNGQKVLVQCKKWRYGFNGYMKIAPVRELGGCMLRDSVSQGIFIGTLGYDKGTQIEASKMNIRLIDGIEIAKHMQVINPRFNQSTKPSLIKRFLQKLLQFIHRIFWD